MIRINLLPPEYEIAQSQKEQRLILGSLGGILFVILMLVWVVKKNTASNLEEQIAQAETELKSFQIIVAQIQQIEADKNRLAAKSQAIKDLNRGRLLYPVLFEDLLPIIPSDVWITSLQISDQQNGQFRLSMNSNALSNFALATWLTNLQQSTNFSDIDLGGINYSKNSAGTNTLGFVLNCSYRHTGPMPLSDVF